MTTKESGRGQRIVRMTPEALEDILVNGGTYESNLPDDARLLSFMRNRDSQWNFWFKFDSEEWSELVEGKKIPCIDVKIEKKDSDVMYFTGFEEGTWEVQTEELTKLQSIQK